MPTLLLVDGSSYLYRAFHAVPDLRNAQGEPTGAIYGVLNMMRRLDKDYGADFKADFKTQGVAYKACVFDAKGKTFRDDWYPEYKANRPSMPADLVQQIAPIHAGIAALGWPIVMVEGVEADDVIGTLAKAAAAAGIDVVISTGDKDLAQLVDARISLVNTMSNEVLDVAGVSAKFGVPPERIVDYLTLIGDTVDNVPGVAKVGPKTALKWLTQYGSLDGVMAAAANISGVVGENLRAALDFLPLGRKLVTIRCDLSLPVAVDALQALPLDVEALSALFTRYEMKSWLREIQAHQTPPIHSDHLTPAMQSAANSASTHRECNEYIECNERNDSGSSTSGSSEQQRHASLLSDDLFAESLSFDRSAYAVLTDLSSLAAWLAKLSASTLSALTVLTGRVDPRFEPFAARLVGLAFAVSAGEAAYLPLNHVASLDANASIKAIPLEAALAQLKPWLESATHGKVGQDIKFISHVLANHGIQLAGAAHDTLLQAYVLESGKDGEREHSLPHMALRHLGIYAARDEDLCGKGAHQISFSQVAISVAAPYAAEKADICLRLHAQLYPKIAADSGLKFVYEAIEMPVSRILCRMERLGVRIDDKQLAVQSAELASTLQALESEAHRLAGKAFNLGSPKQLADILFVQLGLPVKKKTPSGAPSTDEEVLSELALDYPLPKLLLTHRQLAKLKNTYTDKLPTMQNADTGRVHTRYAQAVAITGRLASSEPNLQNIPVRNPEGRRVRAAFIAPPNGHLVCADYSQIELRIMAHLSEDARLLAAFAQGEDVHQATAAEIFNIAPNDVSRDQRRVAKVINFGLIYGMSAFGLARELRLERRAAQAYSERYFARYPGVARYMEDARNSARRNGYVETVFGRRLWLPEIHASHAGRRQGAERAAINAPMQGSAADLIKLAMIAVQSWIDTQQCQTRLIMQVHDELVLEVPDTELALIRVELPALMTEVASLRVPLLVELGVGQNWDEAH